MNRRLLLLGIALTLAGCGQSDSGTVTGSSPGPLATAPAREAVRERIGWQPSSTITQVDVSASGVSANNPSSWPALNRDGSIVAFSSKATNLDGGTGTYYQVFKKDQFNGGVTMVSRALGGQEANHNNYFPTLSGSGARIAFQSQANNLAQDSGGSPRIYAREGNNYIILATEAYDGADANSGSYVPRMGGEDHVTYYTWASNLYAPDTNNDYDVLVKQPFVTPTGPVKMASLNSSNAQANSSCTMSDVSDDGRYVAFRSYASNLGVAGNAWRIYLRDTQAGTLAHASAGVTGADYPAIAGDGSKVCFLANTSQIWVYNRVGATSSMQLDRATTYPQLSDNGRFLVAARTDDPAFANDTDGVHDVYVKDLTTGVTALASVGFTGACSFPLISGDGSTIGWAANNHVYTVANPLAPLTGWEPPVTAELASINVDGEAANGSCYNPRLSQDGRYLAFQSQASNLHPDAPTVAQRVFRKDLFTGAVELVSRQDGTNAAGDGGNFITISSDGSKIAFSSSSGNLTNTTTPGYPYSTGYLRNLTSQTTVLLGSETYPSGFGGNDYVAFYSGQPMAGDTDYTTDCFLYRLSTGVFSWLTPAPFNQSMWGHQVSNDGRYSAFTELGSGDRPISVRDNQTGQIVGSAAGSGGLRYSLSGDGSTIASRWSVGHLKVKRLADPLSERTITSSGGDPVLSDDGRYTVHYSGGTEKVYDWNTQASANVDPLAVYFDQVDISGDGRTIAFLSGTGAVYVKKNPLYAP